MINNLKNITVIGMGYVGVPCALSFAKSSEIESVIGIQRSDSQLSKNKIDKLNNYENPLDKDEPHIQTILNSLKTCDKQLIEPYYTSRNIYAQKKFKVTSDWSETKESDVFIICIQTPVSRGTKRMETKNILSIVDNIFTHSKEKPLIIIESTVFPTFTSNFITNYITSHHNKHLDIDYYLAHAPERVMVGKLIENITLLPRIIGGASDASTLLTERLYQKLSGDKFRFITMTSTEAEITKTSENAIRDVQIAMANELAIICDLHGADFYKVREGVNSLKGEGIARNLLLPGVGVGGHCLTKDTYLLLNGEGVGGYVCKNSDESMFLKAREFNDNMCVFVVDKVDNIICKLYERDDGKCFDSNGVKIGILGYSFIKNSGDFRETPTQMIINEILNKCYCIAERGIALGCNNIMVHDSYVNFEDAKKNGGLQNNINVTRMIDDVLKFSDIIIVVVDHDEYFGIDVEKLLESGVIGIVDCKNVMKGCCFVNNNTNNTTL